ncbi:MAG: FeoB-associated Cys-rich membrane protein [Pyrinomonadaceae bacterium]|nr:FeoB-associated Cys-rich membrane protein [Pyrinomonadaceae bacterium]
MSLQSLIVFVLIAAAVIFGAAAIWRKRTSFSAKPGCGGDCGCGKTSGSMRL